MSESFAGDLAAAVAGAGLPPIIHLPVVASTNDEALSLAQAGANEFTSVLADEQRAGRGRRGRSWASPPGAGMYLSIIVRDAGLGAQVPLVTLAAGVAVAQAVVDVSGLPVELKWPNDIVIGRPWRKLAGILCEASALGTPQGVMVVGVGVNLQRAAYPPEVTGRATSLDAECDRPVALADLVVASLIRVRECVGHLREGRRVEVLERWRQFGREALDNRPVSWHDNQGLRRGFACGVSDTGALLVRAANPASEHQGIEELIAGDVQWEMSARG
ncbi:MAG TPA: biotin--[acetyl-CoA-carboxylase] ligase [Vicinamibacterales bacterium]|nr:biotin--[acetyl-CoA-carboxylase] ligase [Vicinamibacterales bacterium]